jgi:hypothetical protein
VSTIKLKTEHNINNTTQSNRTSKRDRGAQQAKENNLADGRDLKVPKREIFDRSDFPDFYTIKSLREGDFGVKI